MSTTAEGLTFWTLSLGRRENSRKLRMMVSRCLISSAMTSKSSFSWGSSLRLLSREKSRIFTEVSGLRMLWATPAASLPTRASFSVWRRVSRLSAKSVLAWFTSSSRAPTRSLSAPTSLNRVPGLAPEARRRMGSRICVKSTQPSQRPRKVVSRMAARDTPVRARARWL